MDNKILILDEDARKIAEEYASAKNKLEKIMNNLREIVDTINNADTPLQKRILLLETIGNIMINVKNIPVYEALGILEAVKLNIMLATYPTSSLAGELINQYMNLLENNK